LFFLQEWITQPGGLMHWYYEKGGGQVGPLTDEQFRAEVSKGRISQDTLVWNESLTNWTKYGTVAKEASSPPPAPAIHQPSAPVLQSCSQCSRRLPEQEMIQYGGLWICAVCKPAFFQRLKEEGRVSAIWRDGKFLVAARDTVLPDRCVKCNRPARGIRMTKKLYWHPPAYYLLVCAGLLLYAIVALIVRKTATLHLGICEEHKSKRRRSIAIAWSLVAVAILLLVVSATTNEGAFAGFSVLLILGAIIFGIVTTQLVAPVKIDSQGVVWLKGVPPAYLEGLPAYRAI
jgi:hypothetical protein